MPTKTPQKTPPPQQEKQQLTTVSGKLAQMDAVAERYLATAGDQTKPFSSTIALASAMTELRQLMTPDVMANIMPLMNSPLGFLTDKNPLVRATNKDGSKVMPYSEEVVRDCVIEGVLRGFQCVGNEINIIAGRFYGAKSGFERLVRTFPGIANYTDGFDVPRMAEKGAVVACWAEWSLNGNKQRIDRKFAVKGDQWATADAYLGKAARKLAAAVYARLTGKVIPEGEVGDTELPAPPEKPPAAAWPVVNEEPGAELSVQDRLTLMLEENNVDLRWFLNGLVVLKAIESSVEVHIKDLPDAVAEKCVKNLSEVLDAIEAYELASKQ